MNAETAISSIDRLIQTETGKHLNDLQIFTIEQIWLGKKYIEIADNYHCTEGHVKDVAAALWQLLSQILGERVTKTNLKSILQRHIILDKSTPPTVNTTNDRFIGRENSIARLDELIYQGQRTIVIQGEGGIGKTTLAQEYLKTCGCELILELSMAKETSRITPAESVVEEWLRQDLATEPGREFGVTLLRLKRQLSNRRIGILIDNLEPALDRDGRIITEHRSYVELLQILTDRQLPGITLITSRDRLCEVDLNLTHYRLSGLDLTAWQTYFSCQKIINDPAKIAPIHQLYGGNAKAMEIIAGNIRTDFDSDLDIYLQATKESSPIDLSLQQLITAQFDRLQQLDPDAYELLCRAGCYRYQDLAKISVDALLCLLWDVEGRDRHQVINALKNRSLIEFHRGKYWLHPAIRSEAISRLRMTDIWIEANLKAARFWSDVVVDIFDINTAIIALEAYYHYLEISDLDRAAQVLLKPYRNRWGQFLPLASNLYRLGFIQPVLAAIDAIVHELSPNRIAAELHNILGDLYWTIGRVHEAIATQQYAIEYTIEVLSNTDSSASSHEIHCLEILNIDSLLSVGLYQVDLWELIKARDCFERVIALSANTDRNRWAQKATICLALVQSYLHDFDKAKQLLVEIEALIDRQKQTGSSAYFLQIIAQTYTNLGEYDRANIIYQQTLTFCQTGNYLQTQGRTLTGLARLQRLQGNLKIAQSNHLQSIEILDRIGAKCDLAEAYYQAGLTCKRSDDLDLAHHYIKDLAHQLFTEIVAPQQLARIESGLSGELENSNP